MTPPIDIKRDLAADLANCTSYIVAIEGNDTSITRSDALVYLGDEGMWWARDAIERAIAAEAKLARIKAKIEAYSHDWVRNDLLAVFEDNP